MRRFALLQTPQRVVLQLQTALGSETELVPTSSAEALWRLAATNGVAGAIIGINHQSPFDLLVAETRKRFPAMLLVGHAVPGPDVGRRLSAFLQLGGDAVVLAGYDAVRAAIDDASARRNVADFAQRIALELAVSAHQDIAALIVQLVPKVGPGFDVRTVASAASISRRTLTYRARRKGLPSPGTSLGWARLITAAQLLRENPQLTIDSIARRVGFSSAECFRLASLRLSGMAPSRLRTAPLAPLLDCLVDRHRQVRTSTAIA